MINKTNSILKKRVNMYAKSHPHLTDKRFTMNAISAYLFILCSIVIFSTTVLDMILHILFFTVVYGTFVGWTHRVIDWVEEEVKEVAEAVEESIEEVAEKA